MSSVEHIQMESAVRIWHGAVFINEETERKKCPLIDCNVVYLVIAVISRSPKLC